MRYGSTEKRLALRRINPSILLSPVVHEVEVPAEAEPGVEMSGSRAAANAVPDDLISCWRESIFARASATAASLCSIWTREITPLLNRSFIVAFRAVSAFNCSEYDAASDCRLAWYCLVELTKSCLNFSRSGTAAAPEAAAPLLDALAGFVSARAHPAIEHAAKIINAVFFNKNARPTLMLCRTRAKSLGTYSIYDANMLKYVVRPL